MDSVNTEEAGPGDDSGLVCLALILKFLQIAAEPAQLKHQLGAEAASPEPGDLARLAKRLGARSKVTRLKTGQDLADYPLPAIGRWRHGGYFILGKYGEDRVLVQDPAEGKPATLALSDFEARWSGELLLVTTRSKLAGDERAFDVSWFIPALVKYRGLLGDVLAASFFLQLFGLITPLFFQVVIDKVLVHKGLTTLDVMLLGLAVVSVFEVLMGALRTYVFSHTTNRVDVELGSRLFDHLLRLPLSYFESRPVGHSVARVRELENIRDFLTSSSVTLILDLFFTVVFFAVMYLYSPFLTLIVAASLPFYILISVFITPPLRARLDEKFKRGAENQAFLVESVVGVETLKAMAVEPQMKRQWEEKLAGYVGSSFSANMLGNWGSQSVQLVNKLTIAATLYFGAKLAINGDITIGQLVAFNMLAGRVAMPILRLAQLWQDFQQMRISVARLGDVLNTPAEPSHNPNRTNLGEIKGDIRFEQVTFRYRPDGPEVLRRVNFSLQPGEILGIVGPSGSGKSTLAKLVQRMYVPESGRVLIDGIDLTLADPAWLRRQIGVVLQENILFKRPVRENIALSDPARDMNSVMAAAQLAGAHDFILQLSEGYDTQIDERGGNLSGGQRQRIAIARALLTNPRILVFDEATSALDAESEEIIQNNLKVMARGRTVMIIAHRLSAIRQADRIIALDKGEIVEEGSHQALLERDGIYARLWRKQMGLAGAAE
ncbi:type I secretion system permease/ATPase [Hyphococcus luteus]|uniref:Type I secretion system permease/ATPase n=1 Tax=Hyphococcus luteus TaxID=2058213 RepID=A0A2S7K4V5_9PROT|nr:type I secretion system permease/ATPase [Marinicaulis flavus]PQA87544.1 type I secretion system permease/ATPase [Marinicaulis flavus]